MRTEQTNMKVIVRVRPYNRRELEQNQRCIVKVMDPTTLLFDPDVDDDEFFFQGAKQNFRDITKRVHKKLSMEFDRVFDTDATNRQIFEQCTAPLVDSVLNGYNCSVFVYGATGAGKTFTMLGSEECAGLAYLTMRDLFEKLEAQSENRKFNVAVSYLEVYNEQVMNLLTKTGPLKLREDSTGVAVSGLVPKPIYSAEELLDLLKLGNGNRTQHPTDANAESSRSHAVFQVHIRITDRKTDIKRTVKLSMIDLAGSERAASTKGLGLRFREGANINKSLLALGNCINKLADGLKHIPYRDSNLTRILKDSLGGNCQTLMVANVSMSSLTFEDTYNTLKYASRAKKIRSTLRQNALKTNMPKDFYIRKVEELMTENNRLKESQKTLEANFTLLQNTTTQPPTVRTYDEIELKNWYWKIDAVYSRIIKIQENDIGLQSKIKIMNYGLKMKEYAKSYRNILSLNQPLLKQDVEQFTTAMNRIGKQIEEYTEEQTKWRKKLQDAYQELEKLKKNIKSSKYYDILQIYEKYKDIEVQLSKQNIKTNHISSINTNVVAELKKLQQSFTLSCEVLQKYYEDYGSNMNIEHNLNELLLMLCQNMELIQNDTTENNAENDVKILINGKRIFSQTIDDTIDGPSSTKKHNLYTPMNLDFDTEIGQIGLIDDDADSVLIQPNVLLSDAEKSHFKMPMAKKLRKTNLNETHVLLPSTNTDWNNKTFEMNSVRDSSNISETFDETPDKNIKISQKKEFVANILSENLVQLPKNKKIVQNGLLKAQNFGRRDVLKTVAIGMQKENKKHSPNRIRKSPRSKGGKTISSVTKNKLANSSNGTIPIVRTNRAASFRSKK